MRGERGFIRHLPKRSQMGRRLWSLVQVRGRGVVGGGCRLLGGFVGVVHAEVVEGLVLGEPVRGGGVIVMELGYGAGSAHRVQLGVVGGELVCGVAGAGFGDSEDSSSR